MMKQLIGSSMLEENVRLKYYTTEKVSVYGNEIYGLEIIKQMDDMEEVQSAYELSYSKEMVEKLANYLYRNLVTPVCMLHIVDERMTIYENAVQSVI